MSTPSWNLSVIYQGLDDPKIDMDIDSINSMLLSIREFNLDDHCIEDIQQAMITYQSCYKLVDSLETFSHCYLSVDTLDTKAHKLAGQVAKLKSVLKQAYLPVEQVLLTVSDDKICQILTHEDPEVSEQDFPIRMLRSQVEQTMSVAEEQLISALETDGRDGWARLYQNITGTLKVVTESGEKISLSQAANSLNGNDFKQLENNWRGIQDGMEMNKEAFAAILNGLSGWRLSENEKRSKGRKIHFLDASLHQSRITSQSLETLMKVTEYNKSLGQKAGLLMARVHQCQTMKPWNYLAGMPSISNKAPKVYSFEEAFNIVQSAFSRVSKEMGDFVALMVQKGWIDANPTENRRLGAYCSGFSSTRTPLVFMTWGGSLSNIATLAHELGHAYHNWVMRDMPHHQTKYPMTLAETASTFAESVVRDYLLENAETREDKLEILWEDLSRCYTFMINIPVRYHFELQLYQKRSESELSADQLCELMSQTWRSWYGPSMDEADSYFWASKLHFSMSHRSFYNYPYLFGYLFSTSVYSQRSLKGQRFHDDYIALLRDTGRMTAEELTQKHLGQSLIQESFWQQSIDNIKLKIEQFELLLDQ